MPSCSVLLAPPPVSWALPSARLVGGARPPSCLPGVLVRSRTTGPDPPLGLSSGVGSFLLSRTGATYRVMSELYREPDPPVAFETALRNPAASATLALLARAASFAM